MYVQAAPKIVADEVVRPGFLTSRRVCVLGAAVSHGQPRAGVEHGSDAIRGDGKLREMIEGLGWAVNDVGNVVTMETAFASPPPLPPGAPADKFSRRPLVAGACRAVYDAARAGAGDFVLTLGGDHSVAVGSVAATVKLHPDAVVVWVDAHADFNIEATSDYAFLHGFPLGYLCGRYATDDASHPFAWLTPESRIRPSRVRLFGVRDVDPPERATLRELGVPTYTMMDVVRLGAGAAVDDLVSRLPRGAPIHLSFDIDALDPREAPATGTPVPGGMLLREGMYLASALAATGRLVAADMVEVNPRLGGGDAGRDMTVHAAQWVRPRARARTCVSTASPNAGLNCRNCNVWCGALCCVV